MKYKAKVAIRSICIYVYAFAAISKHKASDDSAEGSGDFLYLKVKLPAKKA